ncbi:MAG: prolipoprotein diacylglyceryl transferase [Clostridia bacterium]|nr:prolipoprotein diacylglyceryl transferase [Clostridia bacterium]
MHPEPLFEIFGKGVYAYGICMAGGIVLCFGFLLFTLWYKKFNDTSANAVLVIGILGTAFGIFMAMLVQSILNYAKDPSQPFRLAGMTFMGGLLGGVVSFVVVWNLYVFVIGPRTKISWLSSKSMNAGLSDALPFIPIGIAIAHAFGRLGCNFAGCCYGAPTDGSWGLACAAYDTTLRIPAQLFEMSFLLLLAGVMALLYFRFKFNYNFSVYAIAYGIWRFILEYFRADDRGAPILGLQPSQFWSILMVIAGIGYFFLQYFLLRKLMKHPEIQNKGEKKDKIQLTEDGTPVLVQGAEVSRVVPAETSEPENEQDKPKDEE